MNVQGNRESIEVVGLEIVENFQMNVRDVVQWGQQLYHVRYPDGGL